MFFACGDQFSNIFRQNFGGEDIKVVILPVYVHWASFLSSTHIIVGFCFGRLFWRSPLWKLSRDAQKLYHLMQLWHATLVVGQIYSINELLSSSFLPLKSLINVWRFAGGSGVPPGTRPETCRRCKGSGMVSFICYTTSTSHFSMNVVL